MNKKLSCILVLLVLLVYFLFKDSLFSGQSLGKRLLGLRVVSYSNYLVPCSVVQSVKRNVYILSVIFPPIIVVLFVWGYLQFGKNWRRAFGETVVVDLNEKVG